MVRVCVDVILLFVEQSCVTTNATMSVREVVNHRVKMYCVTVSAHRVVMYHVDVNAVLKCMTCMMCFQTLIVHHVGVLASNS